jgi:hypothetical protein
MGREKDRLIEQKETWERIAQEKGYFCEGRGNVLTK